jgi:Ala-tRNA(Pro) deacylase
MKEKVLQALDASGLPYRTIEHVAVHHVGEEPPELAGLPTTKNLLLKDRSNGRAYMVVMEGEKRLDLGLLADELATTKNRLQFVKYEDVERVVGVSPGHVSIFNLLNEEAKGVQIVFDKSLLHYPEIGFHPNINTATVLMRPDDALVFLKLHGQTSQLINL